VGIGWRLVRHIDLEQLLGGTLGVAVLLRETLVLVVIVVGK
jgi:hypothetical protein